MPVLQRHSAWKRGKKSYAKWVIVLPEDAVKEAEFKEGDLLVCDAKQGEIKLIGVKHLAPTKPIIKGIKYYRSQERGKS